MKITPQRKRGETKTRTWLKSFGWGRGKSVGKGGMGSGVSVTKGDDVNEIEVWKQGLISVLEHQAQHRGKGEAKGRGEGRALGRNVSGCG